MQAAHERGFAHTGAAFEDDPAFQLRLWHQVIKTGDKAVRPHGAGEKRAYCAQKYPSQKRLAKAVASVYGENEFARCHTFRKYQKPYFIPSNLTVKNTFLTALESCISTCDKYSRQESLSINIKWNC